MIKFEIGMDYSQELLYVRAIQPHYSFVGVNFWTGITAIKVSYRDVISRKIVLNYVPFVE